MNNKLIKLAHEISTTPLMVHVSSDIGKVKYIFNAGIPPHYLLMNKGDKSLISIIKDKSYIFWTFSKLEDAI